MLVTCLKRVGFFFRKGNVTSRHEPGTLISWSLPRQRDVTPYRSPGCADVLRGARADVMDFSYMTLMDTSAVKHNMLKKNVENPERREYFVNIRVDNRKILKCTLSRIGVWTESMWIRIVPS